MRAGVGYDGSVDEPFVNTAMVVPRTEAEGPGLRFAIWGQGCPLRCPGCCNPEMLAFVPRTARRPSDLVEEAVRAGVEGVSFLGGEPFAQAEGFAAVAEGVQARGLTVMVFSGYPLKVLRARPDEASRRLLAATDLLVDGPYIEAERTTDRRWIGSANQGLRFLTDRYQPDDPRFAAPNHLEIRLVDGVLELNGWPVKGADTSLP